MQDYTWRRWLRAASQYLAAKRWKRTPPYRKTAQAFRPWIEPLEARELLSLTPTQTAIQASAALLFAGQPEDVTATVSVLPPGGGTPTGNVDFFDNGVPIGFGTLDASSGVDQATFSTAGLTVGAHVLTASYDGDTDFAGSTVAASDAAIVTVSSDVVPTLIAPTSDSVTTTSATLGGTVTSNGGTFLSTRGILYAPTVTNAFPSVGGPGVTEVDDPATTVDAFTADVTGLSPGTAYSFVAFATNDTGPAYSPVGIFTTLSPVTVALTAPTVTYGTDAMITVTLTSSGSISDGDNVQLTVDDGAPVTQTVVAGTTTFDVTGLGAGDHTLSADYAAQGSFADGSTTGTLHVNPAILTVTTDPQTKVYGDAFTAFTGTISGLQNGDDITANYDSAGADETAIVGNYAITPDLDDPAGVLGNYVVNQTGNTLTVTPAPLTVTADDQSKVYGDTFTAFTGGVDGLLNGDNITADYSSPGAAAAAGVGGYAITATLNDPGNVLGNYTVSQTDGTLTVTPASLTISADDQAMVYGGALPALTVSYDGFVNGDSTASLNTAPVLTTTAGTGSHVGDYDIDVGSATAANYDITFVPGTLVVTPGSLTITADDQTMVYGAGLPSLTVHYSGFVNGDSANSLDAAPDIETTAADFSPVGTFDISAAAADDPDYNISYVDGTLTVTPAPLTITATSQSMVYGGVLPQLTVSYSGLVNGDTPDSLDVTPVVSTPAGSGSLVGSYAITASGAADANYQISYVPGTLTVVPAPLTISANSFSKAYGDGLPAFTVEYSGFVNGDGPASLGTPAGVSTAADSASPVGSYSITVAGAADPNYVIDYNPGTLDVTPVPLTISADNQDMAFGDALPALTVSYSGFVNSDTTASLAVPPNVDTTGTPDSPAGIYLITADGADDGNYNIVYVDGTLSIHDVAVKFLVSAPASAIAGSPVTFTVTAKDPDALADSAYTGTVNITSTDAGALAVLPANATVVNGTGTFTATFVTAGPQTLTVTDPALGVSGDTVVTIHPAAASQLGFGEPILIVTHGQALNPAPTVQIQDAYGNVVPTSSATVSMTVASGPGTFRNTSTLTSTASAGIATFSNLIFDTEGAYTVKASASGLANAVSNSFLVDDPSEVDAGGLFFRTNDNSDFSQNGNTYSTSADLVVGIGAVEATYLKFTGTTTIDVGALSFATTGTVSAVIGGADIPLLNGTQSVSIAALLGAGLTGLAGRSFTVAGAAFTLNSLALDDGSTSGVPQVKLQGGLALPGGLSLAVNGSNFVTIGSAGVSFTEASATLSKSFTIGGLTFDAQQLTAAYTVANNVFALSGNSSVTLPGGLGTINVHFGTTASPGLVITNGMLTSLTATLDSNLSRKAVTFGTTGLVLSYAADQFTMTGAASATVSGIGNLNVNFGGGSTQGLVITNGALTSLNMTVTSNMVVQGVTFGTTGLVLSYTTASNEFTMAGTAAVNINGIANLSATFGQGSTPGLVITNGALTSLNLTVNSTFTVSAVTFTGKDLNLTYTAANSQFTLSGTAAAGVKGIANFDVTFGQGATPGLVVTSGQLTSLNMTANTTFTVGAVAITGTNLNLTYVAATSTYTLSGGASLAVKGIANLNVTFGQGTTPGLVITSGALTSLNMTVSSTFTVNSVTFTGSNLNLTYDAATSTYTLSGGASLAVKNIANLNVTFGQGTTPGLAITGGALVSLNMTVSSAFTVSSVTFATNGLNLTYTAAIATAPSVYTLTGNTSLTVTGIANLSVTFGQGTTPGLVITDGALTNLNLTVTGSFAVAAVTFTATSLNLTYTAAKDSSPSVFTLTGDAGVAIKGMGNLTVTFGSKSSMPGLVITNGALTSLDMIVNGMFMVSAVTFTATKLELTYTAATTQITLSGDAAVTINRLGNLSVTFGAGPAKPGLVVTAGALTSLDMIVNGSFTVALVTIGAKSLELTYTAAQGTTPSVFTMTGNASLAIKGMGDLNVSFGFGTKPGLVITGGALTSLDMTVNGSFSLSLVTFTAKGLEITYTAPVGTTPSVFTMTGNAGLTIKGVTNLNVQFGQGTMPGLVITNGALTSLNMTVNGSFTVAFVSISATQLNFTYTAATSAAPSVFTMTGTAGLTIKGMGNVSVTFGTNTKPGLVITDGSLTSLNMIVNGSFTVAFITITAVNLEFDYTAATTTAPSVFSMSGTAAVAIAKLGNVSVTFAKEKGLVVTDGTLTSLDMTVNGSFSLAGVTISATGLRLTYSAAASTFTMTGTAGVVINKLGNLSVTFGSSAGPGLVIVSGVLKYLNMTVNSSFTVSSVTIFAKGLNFTYTADTSTYTLGGTAGIDIQGKNPIKIAVTFGHGSDPGLVVSNGTLQFLNMTINSDFTISKYGFSTKDLEFTYVAATSSFSLQGAASVIVKGSSPITVTFGRNGVPGIVIANGALVSLAMSVTGTFELKGVTIMANGLGFTYVANTDSFAMFGTGGIAIQGKKGISFSVTFGDNGNPGLLIQNGALVSLDVAVTSSINVRGVTFFTKDLRFSYVTATGTFNLSGTAGATIAGIVNLNVTFGSPGVPGITISNGQLQRLDMTVNGNFSVAGILIGGKMRYVYTAADDKFTMTGNAGVTIPGIGSLNLVFGYKDMPGLVIQNGTLQSLALSIKSDLSIGPASLKINDMALIYTAGTTTKTGPHLARINGALKVVPGQTITTPSRFTISGDGQLSVGPLVNVRVDLGTLQNPGLLIDNGTLTSLNMTVNGSVNLFAFKIQGNLTITYTNATKTFTMTGSGNLNVALIGDIGFTLGGSNSSPGLVITNGQLTTLKLKLNSSFTIFGVGFKDVSLLMKYQGGSFQVFGNASINLPIVGAINLNFGTPNDAMVLQDGALQSLNITQSVGFKFGGFGINGTLNFAYVAGTSNTPSLFTLTGTATITFGTLSVTMNLGGPGSQGLVISNGTLTNLDGTFFGSLSVGALATASGNGYARFDPNGGQITLNGTVRFEFLTNMPDFIRTFYKPLVSQRVNIDLRYLPNDLNNSQVYISTTILGAQVGVSYNFGSGQWTINAGPFQALVDFGQGLGKAFTKTADALANAYKEVSKGAAIAYNFTVDALSSAANTVANVAQKVATVVVQGAQAVGKGIVSVGQSIVDFFTNPPPPPKGKRNLPAGGKCGPLAGATVYYDANFSFNLQNAPFTTTAADGSFDPPVPAGATGGQLVLIAGTDISTGLANPLVLTAPWDASQIDPFTTLVNLVMQQAGISEGMANDYVDRAFGLDTNLLLDAENVLDEGVSGDTPAAKAIVRDYLVYTLNYQVCTMLSGVPGAPSLADLSKIAFSTVASAISQSGGAPFDYSDANIDAAFITNVAAGAGVSINPDVAARAATVIAQVFQEVLALPVSASAAYLEQALQAQVVSERIIAPEFAQVEAGTMDISAVVADNTGAALTTEVNAATIGQITGTSPLVSIAPLDRQAVGAGDPSSFQFEVFLTTDSPLAQPVTVDYATMHFVDAPPDGDYTPVMGTLTWLPGDTSPKIISVPVSATNTIAADKEFLVYLTDATNADIDVDVAVGDITDTDYATTTTLMSSPANPTFGQPVTLTATVTNMDPALDAGTGSVQFLDGTTVLGTAPLVNGVATLTVTTLTGGTHDLTASYTDNPTLVGENFEASASAMMTEDVGQGSEAIVFAPIADQVYGAAPFTVSATSSSGLDVSYQIVSGPATLIDNQVTVTGVGQVVIEAMQAGDSDLTAAPPVSQSFMVNPAPLTVTADDQTMVYGGALPTFTATFVGLVNGDTPADLASELSFVTAPANSAVGSYAIMVGGSDNLNYDITYVDGTLTVTPAPLTISANDQTMVYGSAALPALTVSYDGFVNGDTVASLSVAPTLSTDTTAADDVGTYEIDAAGAVGANYDIIYVPGNLFITPASLTITADNQTITYGDDLPNLTVHYSGFVNGDSPDSLGALPAVDTVEAGAGAGFYAITPDGAEDGNYTITYVPGELFVMPAPLTITADSLTMTYGGPPPDLTASYVGLVNGDSADDLSVPPTLTTGASDSSSVGVYEIDATGAASPNYLITYVAGALTVTPAPLTITADDMGTVYGGALPELTATFDGLVNGDTPESLGAVGAVQAPTRGSQSLSSDTTGSEGGALRFDTIPPDAAAGSYAIIVSGLNDANYDITYVAGTLTVRPAPLTITADDPTMVYGQTLPTLTVSFAGLVNGDTPANLTTAPTVSTDATDASHVGSYAIDVANAVDPNYKINDVAGTLTITPTPLTVSTDDETTVYGSTPSDLTVHVSGLVNGDTEDDLFLQAAPSSAATGVGSFPILVTIDDPDYALTYVPGTLTVTSAPLTVTVPPQVLTVGQTFTATEPITITGLQNGDNITANYSSPGLAAGAAVGVYPLTATLNDPGHVLGNYTVTFEDSILSILQAPSGNDSPGFDVAPPKFLPASQPATVPGPTPPIIQAAALPGLVGVVAQSGEVWVANSTGSAFQTTKWATMDPSVTWADVLTGDFTGDGRTDLVGRDVATGQWFMSLSTDGTHFTTTPWGTWSTAVTWTDVMVGDFNGDGKADLIGRVAQSGEWWAALSTGTAFNNQLFDRWSAGVTWVDVQAGDLNGDGKTDLIGRVLQTGQWYAGLSNGQALATSLWDTWATSVTWVDVQIGDLNGDGKADLIGRASESGQWWAALSNGHGLANSLWATWAMGVTWVDVRIGDLNGDGKADLIGRVLETGQWWAGLSTGSSLQTSLWDTWSTAVTWVDVQLVDLNGDGKADLTGRALQSGQWWTGLSNGKKLSTSLWDTWSSTAMWMDVSQGTFA